MPTKDQVERDGYALIHDCVSEKSIQALEQALDTEQHGIRNLLSNPIVRELAGSDQLRSHVVPVLGEGCFAVRGIFFNKSPKANWKVSWHQDCVIAVREKLDIEDLGAMVQQSRSNPRTACVRGSPTDAFDPHSYGRLRRG